MLSGIAKRAWSWYAGGMTTSERITQSGALNPRKTFHSIEPTSPTCDVSLPKAEDCQDIDHTIKIAPGYNGTVNLLPPHAGAIDRSGDPLVLSAGMAVVLRSDGGTNQPHGIGWLIISRYA